jgi:glycine cleavage system aminomethyltransferase T
LGQNAASAAPRIESVVDLTETERLILSWAHAFRSNELTVEDVQERFAALDANGPASSPLVAKLVTESQRELEAFRWSMCERGQREEIERIFAELERLLTRGNRAD